MTTHTTTLADTVDMLLGRLDVDFDSDRPDYLRALSGLVGLLPEPGADVDDLALAGAELRAVLVAVGHVAAALASHAAVDALPAGQAAGVRSHLAEVTETTDYLAGPLGEALFQLDPTA